MSPNSLVLVKTLTMIHKVTLLWRPSVSPKILPLEGKQINSFPSNFHPLAALGPITPSVSDVSPGSEACVLVSWGFMLFVARRQTPCFVPYSMFCTSTHSPRGHRTVCWSACVPFGNNIPLLFSFAVCVCDCSFSWCMLMTYDITRSPNTHPSDPPPPPNDRPPAPPPPQGMVPSPHRKIGRYGEQGENVVKAQRKCMIKMTLHPNCIPWVPWSKKIKWVIGSRSGENSYVLCEMQLTSQSVTQMPNFTGALCQHHLNIIIRIFVCCIETMNKP